MKQDSRPMPPGTAAQIRTERGERKAMAKPPVPYTPRALRRSGLTVVMAASAISLLSITGEPLRAGDLGVEFGVNRGHLAFNDVCDDPRFRGEAMADELLAGNMRRDATDCGKALLDGRARFAPGGVGPKG